MEPGSSHRIIFGVLGRYAIYDMPVSVRPASAEKSAAAKSPATHFGKAAAAIMAALSVESGREGKNTGKPSMAACFWKLLRNSLFAATPPLTNKVSTS